MSIRGMMEEIATLKARLAEHEATPLGSKINELIVERGDLREQLEEAREERVCTNRLCPASHKHSLVWCGHMMQETIKDFRNELTQARARTERAEALANRYKTALEWIMPKVHQGNHEGDFGTCGKATCIEYRQALAESGEVEC